MNDGDNDRNSITPRSMASSQLAALQSKVSAMPLARLEDYFRRRNAEGRAKLVGALRGLVDEMESLNRSVVSYEKSVVSLGKLDDIRAAERRRIEYELDSEAATMIEGFEIGRLRAAIEKMELEIKKEKVETELNKVRNPPPPKEAPPDPKIEALRDMVFGGGKYTREAEKFADDLARQRGGKDKLTPEDHEVLRNARRQAAEFDHSKGQR